MRVLVTGAAGFIGSEVVRTLVRDGHEVTAIVRALDRTQRLEQLRSRLRVEALPLEDTSQLDGVLKAARPEAVLHLAWYAKPEDYLVSAENMSSLAMTSSLVRTVLARGCRKFVGVGTCLEYADIDRLRREDDPPDPVSLYASCKVAAWFVLRALGAAFGAEVSWGRIFHLHGPTESASRLLPWIASQLRRGLPAELSDGHQIRDHLHVSDVAAGLVTLMQPGATGVYNVCSGEPVTLRQVAEIVGRALGREQLLRFDARPHRPGEVMFLAGDSRRLRALGWQPRHTLESGIRDTFDQGGGSR